MKKYSSLIPRDSLSRFLNIQYSIFNIQYSNGAALIVVLWALVILSTVMLGLVYEVRLNINMVKNQKDEISAYYIAKAGIEYAIANIRDDNNEYDANNEKWKIDPNYINAKFGGGTYTVKVIDENSKFNLNRNIYNKSDFKKQLSALADLTNIQIDSIVDWLDEDSEEEPDGAETKYYQTLTPPYRCKNGFLDTPAELLMVRGIDYSTFLKLEKLVTVYSYQENTTPDGKKRININTASKEELMTSLNLSKEDAESLIRGRSYSNIGSLLDTDFITRDKFGKISDKITITTKKILPGKININTAPAEVLRTLGLNPLAISNIIGLRSTPFKNLGEVMLALPKSDFQRICEDITVRSNVFTIESTGSIGLTVVKLRTIVAKQSDKVITLYFKEFY